MERLEGTVVAVDIDDTLIETTTQILEVYLREERPWLTFSYEELTDYDWWAHPVINISTEEAILWWQQYLMKPGVSESLAAVAGSITGMSQLKEMWACLKAVTARHEILTAATNISLQQHFSGRIEETIHISRHDSSDNIHPTKVEACRNIGAHLLIEDNIYHANAVASELWIPVLMPLRPWNRHVEIHPLVERLPTWEAITERTIQILSGKTCLSPR